MTDTECITVALRLAKTIEPHLAPQGIHVALTGGVLYKEGQRKDIDLLLYVERDRAVPRNMYTVVEGLCKALPGMQITGYYGFVIKAKYEDTAIDFLYPEYSGGEYHE